MVATYVPGPHGPMVFSAATSSFVPTDLGAALKCWYKADTGVYVDAGSTLATNGQTVQQWNDQSGNGYHLGQATSGNRPTFQSAGFNSKPTILFTAASSKYLFTAIDTVVMGTGNTGSLFFVGQMLTGTGSNGRAVSYLENPSHSDTGGTGGGAAWIFRDGTNNGIASYRNGFRANDAISLATNYRLGNIYDGANDTNYINNVAGTPVAANLNWTSPGTVTVSAESTVPTAFWDGPISEIVMTNTALSSGDRTSLDNYLKTKWGL